MSRFIPTVSAILLTSASVLAADVAPTAEQLDYFEKNVRPVLVESCFKCHGPEKQKNGLRLDSREALLNGSDDGPVITAENLDASVLIRAVRREGEHPMPPKEKLPPGQAELLVTWVKMGAPYPATPDTSKSKLPDPAKHWAFQPVRKPPEPHIKAVAWVKSPIDRFVLAKLEAKGMSPSKQADRRTLIRRATFDLTGLPPTTAEIEAFEKDNSDDAFARVIDRLLASPRYGERWARHWLDVARYSDTKGYVFEEERRYPYAYTYRDWVIRALNDDIPYDRFLIAQIAADQMPDADPRDLAAMGFLTLGRRFLKNEPDIIDDRIDVVTRGTMALTVACARCHDHKYDPIPMADYYSLYGVFASSTEPKELPLLGVAGGERGVSAFQEGTRCAGGESFHVPGNEAGRVSVEAAHPAEDQGRDARSDQVARHAGRQTQVRRRCARLERTHGPEVAGFSRRSRERSRPGIRCVARPVVAPCGSIRSQGRRVCCRSRSIAASESSRARGIESDTATQRRRNRGDIRHGAESIRRQSIALARRRRGGDP